MFEALQSMGLRTRCAINIYHFAFKILGHHGPLNGFSGQGVDIYARPLLSFLILSLSLVASMI